MKPFFFTCLLSFFTTFIFGQNSDYFQQQVDTKITATLDDTAHTLTGNIEITYINNSPDALPLIYMHLWANAYKDRNTAFAQQKLRSGSTKFYFADNEQLGNFSTLNFTVDNKEIVWSYDPNNPDIAILDLAEPLKSGETITIKTPFLLDIPASFSRLGHVGESYQMTQWFPKPAVYDLEGWHPMPYLDMGEFYSEFGSYDVTLTLPKNYVVGATGELQTESERTFLQEKVEETLEYLKTVPDEVPVGMTKDPFPESSSEMKTIRYTAENVHDFAWFADKRFRVQKSSVTLASGKEIDTWAMFTKAEEHLWKKGIDYVDRSVKFYSELVGEYPYPQASAVQSALSAGGGMEYPMITVIGLMGDPQSLDGVITHEVGHNWFYGILAFNERDHVWMDEGLNSYYDHRYTKKYYEGSSMNMLPKIFLGDSPMTLLETGYLFQARRNQDQAPSTHSNEYENINYWIGGYEKPAVVFGQLEAYWGAEKFDPIMQSFYQKWKFKHPQPKDLRDHLEKESGENLDWLFDGFIESNKKMDYAIQSAAPLGDKVTIVIKNKGEIAAPFPISGLKDGQIVTTKWYKGITGSEVVNFPAGDYDQLVIDAERVTLSVDRRNNNYKLDSKLNRIEPLEVKFLATLENDKKSSLYYAPMLAWNNYNKTMLGVALHNVTIPNKKFEWLAAPMYSFVTKELTGFGSVRLAFHPRTGGVEKFAISLSGRTFSYNYDFDYKAYDKYYKLAPKFSFKFRKPSPISPISHQLDYRLVYIKQDYIQGISFDERTFERKKQEYFVNELKYSIAKKSALSPLLANATIHLGKGFSKLFVDADQRFIYRRDKKSIYLNFFGGLFFHSNEKTIASPRFLISGITGSNIFQKDYLFDEFLFGRNDDRGIWSNQIFDRDANLKTISNIGSSTEWMIGIGLAGDLPIGLPLKAYIDAAIYPDPFDEQINFTYSGGIAIPIIKNTFEIYLPFFNSSDIVNGVKYQEREEENNFKTFFNRVTFKFDINRLNPIELRDNLSF